MDGIDSDGELSDEDEEKLGKAIAEMVDDFGPDFDEEGNELEEGESDRVKSEEERSKPGRTDEEAEGEDAGRGRGRSRREDDRVDRRERVEGVGAMIRRRRLRRRRLGFRRRDRGEGGDERVSLVPTPN